MMGETFTTEYLTNLKRLFACVLMDEEGGQICTLHARPYTPQEILEILLFVGNFRPDEINVVNDVEITFNMWRD